MAEKLNTLGQQIVVAGAKAKYDKVAKSLLSNKPFLAWVLKYTVAEYAVYEPEEIVQYIENDPSISSISIPPGTTNDVITGLPQENAFIGEGSITYDIRFYARIPGVEGDKAEVNLMINVEMQNDPNPGYDVVSRGILYCGRMLSEQMLRSDYNHLQKVYSIWLCFNCSEEAANTISVYGITHNVTMGVYDDHARSDLMRVVMVRMPEEGKEDKSKNKPSKLHKLLSTAFATNVPVKEKLDQFANEYNIPVTEKIREEVNEMCNLSQGIVDKKAKEIAANLIRESQLSDGDIAKACGLTEAEVKKLREEQLTTV